ILFLSFPLGTLEPCHLSSLYTASARQCLFFQPLRTPVMAAQGGHTRAAGRASRRQFTRAGRVRESTSTVYKPPWALRSPSPRDLFVLFIGAYFGHGNRQQPRANAEDLYKLYFLIFLQLLL